MRLGDVLCFFVLRVIKVTMQPISPKEIMVGSKPAPRAVWVYER